jgi:hypothetical protein
LVRGFFPHAIWIGSLGWLLSVAGTAIFVRNDGMIKSSREIPIFLKRKAVLGLVGVVLGFILAL